MNLQAKQTAAIKLLEKNGGSFTFTTKEYNFGQRLAFLHLFDKGLITYEVNRKLGNRTATLVKNYKEIMEEPISVETKVKKEKPSEKKAAKRAAKIAADAAKTKGTKAPAPGTPPAKAAAARSGKRMVV